MLHSLNTNSDNNKSEMSVLERQRLRPQWPQEQMILYNEQLDTVFSGFNDQGLGELLMKPDPDLETGLCGGILGFETGVYASSIPRTLSCPPNVPLVPAAAAVSKKRKKAEKNQNLKVIEAEKCDEKKMKGCSEEESKNSSSKSTTTTVANTKGTSESPKPDYIHVRARRGQATDSHSLAERVRREKISERMKYLQDLVPGCNKITGKAGMLDEIINYVQSLQRQVEFLSMKLAVINPRLDFDVDNNNYIAKEMYTSDVQTVVGTSSDMINHVSTRFTGSGQNSSLEMVVNPMDLALRRTISAPQTLLDSAGLNQIQQLVWEDEIHNLYGMDYQQLQAAPFINSQSFTGLLEAGHVKMEM